MREPQVEDALAELVWNSVSRVAHPGATVGEELQENPVVDGIVFTGSYEVGFDIFRHFSIHYPRPSIVEMGGKNTAIVARSADLEEAAEGIMRSAFGFGGQKCSANSRVYVERFVHDALVRHLVEKTEQLVIGDPLRREVFLGPIIDQAAVDRHQAAVADARRDGTVFTGGEHLTGGELVRGFYVEPTVVGNLPPPPKLYLELSRALESEDTTPSTLSNLISQDPPRRTPSSSNPAASRASARAAGSGSRR